ncbi:MAG: nucleoside deaminase [Verrucomicrobiota bacterium]
MDCPFEKLYPSQLDRNDSFYMSLAYNQALEAFRSDEVPVGAVIVRENEVVASAYNEVEATGDPTAHAEILAITQAARFLGDQRLNAMTLYVTKEPCPMCSGAIIMSRVGRVVFGVSDPKMGFLGGAFNVCEIRTLNHFPLITSGVLADECHQLLQAFFSNKRKK